MGIPSTPPHAATNLTFADWAAPPVPHDSIPRDQVENLPQGIASLPKKGAVPLLTSVNGIVSGRSINANALSKEDGFSQSRVLGRTINPEKVVANNSHANQVRSLLRAVGKLTEPSDSGAPRDIPKIVQFISPRAFNNPNQSHDSPMSDLLRGLTDTNVAGFSINSISNTDPRPEKVGCQSRSWRVSYTDGQGVGRTFELIEMAPDFTRSHMTIDSIRDTLAALNSHNALRNACMLSFNGVGRTSIVQVASEVTKKIDQTVVDLAPNERVAWINAEIEQHIDNLRAYRPGYLENRPRQIEEIKKFVEHAISDFESKQQPQFGNALRGSEKNGSIHSETIVDNDCGLPTSGSSAQTENLILKNVEGRGFPNIVNSCYLNAGLKYLMLHPRPGLIQRVQAAIVGSQNNIALLHRAEAALSKTHNQSPQPLTPAEATRIIELGKLGGMIEETKEYEEVTEAAKKEKEKMWDPLIKFVKENESSDSGPFKLKNYAEISGDFRGLLQNHQLIDENFDQQAPTVWQRLQTAVASGYSDRKVIQFLSDLKPIRKKIHEIENGDGNGKRKEELKQQGLEAIRQILTNPGVWTPVASNSQGAISDLRNTVKQRISKEKECLEARLPTLQLLQKFFLKFNQQDPDLTNIGLELSALKQSFESVFNWERDQQQDPLELFDRMAEIFGDGVLFESGLGPELQRRHTNLLELNFENLGVADRSVEYPFENIGQLVMLDQSRTLKNGSFFDMPIKYPANEEQKPLIHFSGFSPDVLVSVPSQNKALKIHSVILHSGETMMGGHYLMLQRQNEDWCRHNDDRVEKMQDLSAYGNPIQYRPVMVRFEVLAPT